MKSKKPNVVLRKRTIVPIYNHYLTLYVSQDALKTYKHVAHHYGLLASRENKHFGAIALTDDGTNHAIIFNTCQIDEDTIAHEVKHCADYILDAIGHKGCKCGEPNAYLLGFVHKWVKQQLKRAKIEVT